MKKKLLVGLTIGIFTFSLTGIAMATPVFEFTSPTNPYTNGSWVFGQKFTVASEDITIDSLGYFDDQGDGFLHDHEVGIFTESGDLLASTTVTSSDTLIDHFRYSDISDLVLSANQQYRVAGVSWNDNYQWIANYTVDSRITDNGYAYYSGNTLGIGDRYVGESSVFATNFNIKEAPSSSVPEPATMFLFGTGLAGLIGIRRKKK